MMQTKFPSPLIWLAAALLAIAPLFPKNAHACGSCGPYKAEKEAVKNYCATGETPVPPRGSGRDGTNPPPPQPLATPLTCAEKQAIFDAEFGQLREYCEAYDVLKKGKSAQTTTAAFYTTAAAVCTTACFVKAGPVAAALEAACMVTGGVAGLTDIIEAMRVKSLMSGLMGAGVLGSAAYTGVMGGGTNVTTVSVGGKQIGRSSCVAAGITALIAGLKWYGASSSGDKADKACFNAGSLSGAGSSALAGGAYGGMGGAYPSAQGGRVGGGIRSSPEVEGAFNADAFMSEARQAATSDPYGMLVSQMPNMDQMPSALEKLGIGLNDIAQGLESQGPGSILSGLPGLPDDAKAGFSRLDEELARLLATGEFDVPGAFAKSGAGASGGGAKKSGEAGFDFGSLLGKKDEAGGSAQKEMNFKTAPEDSDIWHSNWKGSIFQIVSNRLDKSRDKVDRLEWQSPLNRALSGLPKKPEK